MQAESLEQIAQRLGWSPERLQEAERRAEAAEPLRVSARDRARAEALAESLRQTSSALDEAS